MPVITVDLPFPPSVNKVWRIGRNRKTGKRFVYRSKPYITWLKCADAEWLAQKPRGMFQTIVGPFTARIMLSRPDKRRRDDSNYHKAVMDWAQRAGIIKDDANSIETRSGWVTDEEAPMGMRLIISSVDN